MRPADRPPPGSPAGSLSDERSWYDLWLTNYVLEQLVSYTHPEDLLRRVPELARELFPHEAGLVTAVADGEPRALHLIHSYGLNGAATDFPESIPPSQLIDPWAFADGPLHIPDLAATSLRIADLFAGEGMRSLLSIPLETGDDGETAAVLLLADRKVAAFDGVSGTSLQHFRRAVAVPLTNAQRVAAQERQMSALIAQDARLWKVVGSSLYPPVALAQLLDVAIAVGSADAGTIMVVVPETDELYVRASQGMSTRVPAGAQLPWGTRAAAPLRAMAGPRLSRDLQAAGHPLIPMAAAEGFMTYLGLPFPGAHGGPPLGLLNLYWRQDHDPISADTLARLDSITQALAVTLAQSALQERSKTCDHLIDQFQDHKGRTLALMAHQLRTPITSISGFAQLLLRRAPDSANPINRYADTILAEARRLGVLVDNIIELSQLEGSLMVMQVRPFDLVALLQELLGDSSLRGLIAGGAAALELPAQVPIVSGDPLRLKQALGTLLRRAAGPAPPAAPAPIRVHIATAEGHPVVEIVLISQVAQPPAGSIADLLTALDLRDVIDSQHVQDDELALYMALQFLRGMGAELRIVTAGGGPTSYVVTLPVLEEL